MSSRHIHLKIENLNSFYKHPSYYLERKLLSAMKRCINDDVIEILNAINSMERARLADTPLRSTKNSLIASCTLFARAAIESNVNPEDAYSLSDVFIYEIERIMDIKKLLNLEYEMALEFVELIRKERTAQYPVPVARAIQFIHENISEDISLQNVAEHIATSKEYLSTLFKKEVGYSVVEYIHVHKIEESKYFLELTNMTIGEIAELFSFCNPGYYSKIFKKFEGRTPNEYRKFKNT